MRIQLELADGWLQMIRVKGELDAYTAPELQEAITAALDQGVNWIVIDLAETDYIDSVALGILIGGVKRVGEKGGDLAVACDRRNVRKVFEVSGTAEMLNVAADMAEAIEALTKRRAARSGEATEQEGGEEQ